MPQVYQVSQIARPVYYDRQPLIVVIKGERTGGPVGLTVIAQYTVPTLRAAFIESLVLIESRGIVAGALALTNNQFAYTSILGPDTIPLIDFFSNNAVNSLSTQQLTNFGYMTAGDVLKHQMSCGDTGGSVFTGGYMKGTEFVYGNR